MPETVHWQPTDTAFARPYSPRFDDIYRNHGLDGRGGLAQAEQVFLQGCGLPQAWRGLPQWRVLETGFGLGLNFLCTWRAWREDSQRPRLLHYCAIEAHVVSADDLRRSAEAFPELTELVEALCAQWHGLLPGFHRISLDQGRVLLTLCVGDVQAMLRELAFNADSLYLDGFDPLKNPVMWSPHTLKAAARCCRRGAGVATWCVAGSVRDALRQNGFVIKKAPGVAPKRQSLSGSYDPAWEPRRRHPLPLPAVADRCVVIGAGLAGAAVAASLARRGWQVQVLDAADAPASGASGLPAGLLVPHTSPDDSLLSRLSRAGLRISLEQVRLLLREGVDWQQSGVLEHCVDGSASLSSPGHDPGEPGADWSQPASSEQCRRAGLPNQAPALWHGRAAWIRPVALIQALLRHPHIHWQGQTRVASLQRVDGQWNLRDSDGKLLAQAPLVVVAAAYASSALLAPLCDVPLQALRGLASVGHYRSGQTADAALLPFPVNGDGSLVPWVPVAQGDGNSALWVLGSTFERDQTRTDLSAAEVQALHEANRARLQTLLPALTLPPPDSAFIGIRCASPDRLPLVGPVLTNTDQVNGEGSAGLWLSTAMGSRGLSFALLCGELLAARLHGEPLPVEQRLAQALGSERLSGRH